MARSPFWFLVIQFSMNSTKPMLGCSIQHRHKHFSIRGFPPLLPAALAYLGGVSKSETRLERILKKPLTPMRVEFDRESGRGLAFGAL